jgi:hypothetical protein
MTTRKGTNGWGTFVDEISPRDFSMLETTNAHVKNAKFDPRIILRGL